MTLQEKIDAMRPVRAHYVRLINYGMTGPDGLPVVVDVLDQPNWVAPYLKQGYSRYKKSVPPPAEASGVSAEEYRKLDGTNPAPKRKRKA